MAFLMPHVNVMFFCYY